MPATVLQFRPRPRQESTPPVPGPSAVDWLVIVPIVATASLITLVWLPAALMLDAYFGAYQDRRQ